VLSTPDVRKYLDEYVRVKVDPRATDADRSAYKYKSTRFVPEVVLVRPDGNVLGRLDTAAAPSDAARQLAVWLSRVRKS